MKTRPGCCGHCDGEGVDPSAPETGGLCWDCRGTGHSHLGPCGAWETFAAWCHRHELDVLGLLLGWGWLCSFALLLVPAGPRAVAVPLFALPLLVGLPAWVAMSKIGDRQMIRERERGH